MRSILFVPGDSPRKFERARATNASVLILDLEDSVSSDMKDDARRQTISMLDAPRQGPSLFVRINAFDTGLLQNDLAAVMQAAPDGIVLPKCRSGTDVRELAQYLDQQEGTGKRPSGVTQIIAVATETAESIFGLGTYKDSSPRLAGLMWGAEDLAASLGATENASGGKFHSPYSLARDLCLMGAAAAQVAAIDTVFTDIENLTALDQETRAARRDGFSAKAVIHPKHIDIVNAAFEPSSQEREWAERIVAVFNENPDLGVVRIDGKMIDKPHLRAARKVLGLAESAPST